MKCLIACVAAASHQRKRCDAIHGTCAMKRAFAGLATPIGGVDACAVVFVA